MTTRPPLALWVLERLDARGAREALIGDLLEEIARGRSRWWAWQQVLGLCAFATAGYARNRSHVTVPLGALAIGGAVLCVFSRTSLAGVLGAWAAIYLVAGAMSLIGQFIAGRTLNSKELVS